MKAGFSFVWAVLCRNFIQSYKLSRDGEPLSTSPISQTLISKLGKVAWTDCDLTRRSWTVLV